jgi:hypothetical protein
MAGFEVTLHGRFWVTPEAEVGANPMLAIATGKSIVQTFDVSQIVEDGQQALYSSHCEFDMAPTQKALAIAYTFSGDGTGSLFLVVTWTGSYQVVFKKSVGQGRMVLDSGTVELWERTFGKYASRPDSVHYECEWCDHRYLITRFTWRNGVYAKAGSKRTKKAYDPAEITAIPLVQRPNSQPKQ